MEPSVHLQLDFVDEPDDHCLSEPPAPPVVSWYRAVLVELVHQFLREFVVAGWSITVSLYHHDGGWVGNSFLDAEENERLASSWKECARESCGGESSRLHGGASSRTSAAVRLETPPLDVDLWVEWSSAAIAMPGSRPR